MSQSDLHAKILERCAFDEDTLPELYGGAGAESARLLPIIEALLADREELMKALEIIARNIPDSIHTSEVEREQTLAANRVLNRSRERMDLLVGGGE